MHSYNGEYKTLEHSHSLSPYQIMCKLLVEDVPRQGAATIYVATIYVNVSQTTVSLILSWLECVPLSITPALWHGPLAADQIISRQLQAMWPYGHTHCMKLSQVALKVLSIALASFYNLRLGK